MLPLQKESLVRVQSQLPTLDAVVAADKKVLSISCCVLSPMLSMTAEFLYLSLSLHCWRFSKCRLKRCTPPCMFPIWRCMFSDACFAVATALAQACRVREQ